MSDTCLYTELINELQHKLNKTHDQILSGPTISVQVKLGSRIINQAEKEQILGIIGSRENLLVQSIESDPQEATEVNLKGERLTVIKGIIRSGQSIEHEGNLMLFGDVNPGGSIYATGDIYIMGSLRGLAHAGREGNEAAIIAASHLCPTQLRIAGVISRPPDEWEFEKEAFMEFAHIRDGDMVIDKISQLYRIRPEAQNMFV
ncbi:MAG: septum site-determining protein MinC [Gorillibacterium sp.]|nr:septum site-determining protein MinC [Gorillibacterium sp.]